MGILEKLEAKKKKPGLREYAHEALGSLPMAGGIAGGMIGGSAGAAAAGVGAFPGALGGASIGGAGGEALRQLGDFGLGYGSPQTPYDALNQIQKQGLTQGAYELVPPVVGAAAKGSGRVLMKAATKFTPELAQTALQEGISATRAGFKTLMAKVGDLGTKVRALTDQATQSGVRVDANKDIVQKAVADAMPYVNASDNPAMNRIKLMRMAKNWLEGRVPPLPRGTVVATSEQGTMRGTKFPPRIRMTPEGPELVPGGTSIEQLQAEPGKITPTEVLKGRQFADDAIRGMYEKQAKVKSTQFSPLKEQFLKGIRVHSSNVLTSMPVVGDQIAAHNARSSALLDLKSALFPLAKKDQSIAARMMGRSLPVLSGGVAGSLMPGTAQQRVEHGLLGAALGAGMGSPGALSQAALALHTTPDPVIQMLLSQLPRAAGAAFTSAPSDR